MITTSGKARTLSTFISVLCGVAGALAPLATAQPQSPPAGSNPVKILHVQGKVYMLVGPETNMVVQIGDEGVLAVDSMTAPLVPDIMAAIKTLSDKPIHYIIDTTFKLSHTGGSIALRKAGTSVYGGGGANFLGTGAIIIGHSDVVTRMSAAKGNPSPFPSDAWPEEVFINDKEALNFNGEAIEIIHIPNATTDTDSIVFFRGSDVVVAGDLFDPRAYPVIDLEDGGSVNGVIAGLNRILDITVPLHEEEAGTYVVPGHGHVGDQADMASYRDMVTIVRDRIQKMIGQGMTLAQIKEAHPTLDYDPQYGQAPGSSNLFIETVYKSLTKK
jgi:glyoxylase-like metal-dependent hydrolase (beta-lactamase superfamily II)